MNLLSFLIILTKNPQFKKNPSSYSALPHQTEKFTPPGAKSSLWWNRDKKKFSFSYIMDF